MPTIVEPAEVNEETLAIRHSPNPVEGATTEAPSIDITRYYILLWI